MGRTPTEPGGYIKCGPEGPDYWTVVPTWAIGVNVPYRRRSALLFMAAAELSRLGEG